MSQLLSVFLAASLSTYSLSYTFIYQYLRICKHLAQHCTAVVGFIKCRAPCKLTGCGDDFALLFWPSRGSFFLLRSSKCFACLQKPVSLLLKTWKPSMFYSWVDDFLYAHNLFTCQNKKKEDKKTSFRLSNCAFNIVMRKLLLSSDFVILQYVHCHYSCAWMFGLILRLWRCTDVSCWFC